jgi:hypothetical protein
MLKFLDFNFCILVLYYVPVWGYFYYYDCGYYYFMISLCYL